MDDGSGPFLTMARLSAEMTQNGLTRMGRIVHPDVEAPRGITISMRIHILRHRDGSRAIPPLTSYYGVPHTNY